MTTPLDAALAFLSIGGRVMIDSVQPDRFETGLDARVLFAIELDDAEMSRRIGIVHAFDAADPAVILDLTRERGRAVGNGWIVWEEDPAMWKRAKRIYQRARSYSDGLGDDDPAASRAIDTYCVAMDALIETPAPDLAAVAEKIELMRERGCDVAEWADVMLADVRRLEAEGR